MKRVKELVLGTPRASFARPGFRLNEDGFLTISAGTPGDACRFVGALRAAGFPCNIQPWDAKKVVLSCLL